MARAADVLSDVDVHLRAAAVAELPRLLELTAHPDVEPFLSGLTEDRLRASFREPDTEVLALSLPGEDDLVGMLRVDRARFARHRALEVHTVVVDPRRRGEGLGVAALRALQQRELTHGVHRIQAEAYGFNVAARRTFEAAGFAVEGTRRACWWRHEAWQDGLLLGWLAPPS